MIKVKNGIPTREPVPEFLIGLSPETLLDLSWTDPALGVSDCAWWPEDDQSAPLGQYERYGIEVLTLDVPNSVVIVIRPIIPWTAEEIAAATAVPRKNQAYLEFIGMMNRRADALEAAGDILGALLLRESIK